MASFSEQEQDRLERESLKKKMIAAGCTEANAEKAISRAESDGHYILSTVGFSKVLSYAESLQPELLSSSKWFKYPNN